MDGDGENYGSNGTVTSSASKIRALGEQEERCFESDGHTLVGGSERKKEVSTGGRARSSSTELCHVKSDDRITRKRPSRARVCGVFVSEDAKWAGVLHGTASVLSQEE
jgi:hypothetical protein